MTCIHECSRLAYFRLFCIRGFESHEHSVAAVASSLLVAVLHFLPQGMRPHVGQLVVLPCLKAVVGGVTWVGGVTGETREVIPPNILG